MKHPADAELPSVDELIKELFTKASGQDQPDPRKVAERSIQYLAFRPKIQQYAEDIAKRKRKPDWDTIECLVYMLRVEKFEETRNFTPSQKKGGLLEDRFLEAMIFGDLANRIRVLPPDPIDDWSDGSLDVCDFCWRPGKKSRISGLPVVVCQYHRRNSAGGQRLIRMAKLLAQESVHGELVSGIKKLLAEVQVARMAVGSEYGALAAARERYCRANGWADFHDDRGIDPLYDDYLAICAAAWDRVAERYCRKHTARPNAGRPQKWTDAEIAREAEKGTNLSLRDLAQVTGISPATLSRRLRR